MLLNQSIASLIARKLSFKSQKQPKLIHFIRTNWILIGMNLRIKCQKQSQIGSCTPVSLLYELLGVSLQASL